MKVVCGLGNPGEEYEATRHNVGWWVVEALRRAWDFPAWRRSGKARASEGLVGTETVRLLEPLTYMNLSGAALAPLVFLEGLDPTRDLLVVVDDVNLDVGRTRLRAGGSAGGHNGLKSIEASLRTQEYPRLRIGVGAKPPGEDLADWVLSPFPGEEGFRIRDRMPDVVACIRKWVEDGTEAAMNQCNG